MNNIDLKDLVRMPKGTTETYETDDHAAWSRLANAYASKVGARVQCSVWEQDIRKGEVVRTITKVEVKKQGESRVYKKKKPLTA